MSCDAAALAFALHLAAWSPSAQGPGEASALTPISAAIGAPLAHEPLFASIVRSAGRLRTEVEAYKRSAIAPDWRAPQPFRSEIAALSGLDMQGHVTLAQRGTDGDLKCILKGISQDLPRRLAELDAAKDGPARKAALDEMGYLLRDNVEVITTPLKDASTDVARPS